MRDAVVADEAEDEGRIDLAQADMRPPDGGDGPWVAPAVAVKHRQGPQIDGSGVQAEGEGVGQGIQVGTAMVVDDALGIAGRTGGVVQSGSEENTYELHALMSISYAVF